MLLDLPFPGSLIGLSSPPSSSSAPSLSADFVHTSSSADGQPRSCSLSGTPPLLASSSSSQRLLLPPTDSLGIPRTLSLGIQVAIEEDSGMEQQPLPLENHRTTAQSVHLSQAARCALLEELDTIQVRSISYSLSYSLTPSLTHSRTHLLPHPY